MTRELIQEMMSVLKHSDPVDRTSVTAAAQSDVNEPLENLTQAIIALSAQIQSLENHIVMAQTARAQSFEDQVVTGLGSNYASRGGSNYRARWRIIEFASTSRTIGSDGSV